MPKTKPELVPIGEAALRCQITRDRLRRMCETGAVAGELIDGRLHVARQDVERLAAERRAAAASAA